MSASVHLESTEATPRVTTSMLAATTPSPAPPVTEPAWVRPLVERILRESGCHAADQKTPPSFIDFAGLCVHVPLGERTLRELIKRRIIPHVRFSGGRRLLFHLPSVEKALLRFQQGGAE